MYRFPLGRFSGLFGRLCVLSVSVRWFLSIFMILCNNRTNKQQKQQKVKTNRKIDCTDRGHYGWRLMFYMFVCVYVFVYAIAFVLPRSIGLIHILPLHPSEMTTFYAIYHI